MKLRDFPILADENIPLEIIDYLRMEGFETSDQATFIPNFTSQH